MLNPQMGLHSPPFQPMDQMEDMDQLMHFEQLSQGELSVIQQLRRLQLARAQHTPVAGRHEPLGMLICDARQYLEIRQGFSPILVPSHMLSTVREFISENLPRHMQALRGRQVMSPPQSPHPGPTPAYFPMSPGAEQPATPQVSTGFSFSDNAPSSLSGLGAALAHGSGAISPGSLSLQSQYSVTSPMSSLASGAPVSSSAMPSFGSTVNAMSSGLGLTASPSYMDTDDVSPLSQERDGSQDTPAPPTVGAKKARKPVPAKSRKTAKAPRKLTSKTKKSTVNEIESTDADAQEGECGDEDDGECHLRKPPNAFILYRQAQNLKLRTDSPGINVEKASVLIGNKWKNEDEAVKDEYREQARLVRDLYFAKKKRIQAFQRARKIEREELALSPLSRTIAKPRRQTSGSNDLASQLVVAAARDLDSFSPEALAPMSPMSHQEFAAIRAAPVVRQSQSLSLGIDTQQLGSSVFGHASHLARNGAGSSTLTPGLSRLNTGSSFAMGGGSSDPSPFFGDATLSESAAQSISQQVATSLEHLKASFSESPQSSSLTAMAIDPPPLTAPSTTAEWASAAAAAAAAASVHSPDHGGWEGMLNSLFQKAG
ncbi:hypothetical protein GGH94_004777 [Coemansia aciculifera]|uniref:HMG box domain-containing protein n=1 Tax=Coemansia aciculifera TaxID=417176 RepID=A0A9W8IET3_9FUNG|nr:hypothetical protein GGH94_004777 [Coemansia aciculifera]